MPGDALELALIVGCNHYEIGTGFHNAGHVAIECGKATFMLAGVTVVHEDLCCIVHRAEVQEDACVRLGLVVEVSLIPQHSFVEKEFGLLRVPVAGHLERGRLSEIIFLQSAAWNRAGVSGVAIQVGLSG